MTTYTHRQHATALAAADSSYPKMVYFPGAMVQYVTSAAELAALGPGWTTKPVAE